MKTERIKINDIPSIIWGEKSNWDKKTYILYGNKDNLQEEKIIKDFCVKFNCKLLEVENGEHFFYTEEQLEYYRNWLDEVIK